MNLDLMSSLSVETTMETSVPPQTSESEAVAKLEIQTADPEIKLDDHDTTPSAVTSAPTPVIDADSTTVATVVANDPDGEPAVIKDPTLVVVATPSVESVSSNVIPTAVATQVASTSSTNKHLQPLDQQQQNMNMANDWDASDIEKKLSENSSLLSQWSLVLDRNGLYIALALLNMITNEIDLCLDCPNICP